MATKFYYPAFYRKVSELNNFLRRHESELVALNGISGTELTQLQALSTACEDITGKTSTWPKYRYIA